MDQHGSHNARPWWEEMARRAAGAYGAPRGHGSEGPRKRRRSWRWVALVAGLFLLLILLGRAAAFYTDWLWFGEVGQRGVFLKTILTKAWMALAAGAVFFAIAYLNLLLARRMAPQFRIGPADEIVERVKISDRAMRFLVPLLLAVPTLVAMVAGGSAWETFLRFTAGTDFGLADPVFGRDVGFYVFTLPFLRWLQSFLWWTLIFTFVATAAMHLLDYAIDFRKGKLSFASHTWGTSRCWRGC